MYHPYVEESRSRLDCDRSRSKSAFEKMNPVVRQDDTMERICSVTKLELSVTSLVVLRKMQTWTKACGTLSKGDELMMMKAVTKTVLGDERLQNQLREMRTETHFNRSTVE